MKIKLKKTAMHLAIGGVLTSSPMLAASQQLEEIVVYAEKREASLQDVGASMAVISSERLSDFGTANLEDLDSMTSGLRITSSGGGESTIIRIRGIGAPRAIQAQPQFVGTFVDEFTMNRPGVALADLVDVARVEVLRGPQSTLYGKNVPAGALSIYTNRPNHEEFSWGGTFGVAEFDSYQSSLVLNVPLISDTLSMRVAGYYNDRDGDIDVEPAGQSWGASERKGVRAKFLWDVSDNLEALVSFSHRMSDATEFEQIDSVEFVWSNFILGGIVDSPAGYVPATDLSGLNNPGALPGLGPITVEEVDAFNGVASRDSRSLNKVETNLATLHLSYDLSEGHELKYIGGYQEYDSELAIDADGTDVFYSIVGPADFGTEYSSHELRWQYDGSNFNSLVGLFSDKESHDNTLLISLPVFVAEPFKAVDDETEWKTKSVYGTGTYSFNDKLDLTFGGRFSNTDIEGNTRLVEFGSVDTSFEYWSANTKLLYNWTDDIMTYVAIARGAQYGGFNYAAIADPSLVERGASTTFDDAPSVSIELGWKTRLFDDRWTINGALYHQTYDDFHANVSLGSATTFITNVGELETTGIELEINGLLTENLIFDGSVSYTDTEINDFPNAPCSGLQIQRAFSSANIADDCFDGIQDISGKPLNEAPEWTGYAGLTYLTDVNMLNAKLRLRGDVSYRDSFISELFLDPAQEQESYILVNGSATLSWENNVSLSFWGKNILDEDYCNHMEVNGGSILTPWRGVRCNTGRERQFGVTISYAM